MSRQKSIFVLLLSLVCAYTFSWLTFSNDKVFWYFYSFTTLFLMSVAFYFAKLNDNLKTSRYIILGITFGVLTYALFAIGYKVIDITSLVSTKSATSFVNKFGPVSIWHYLMLLLIIAPGEELFWRGFIQQQLKKWLPPVYSIIVSAALFGFSFIFSGFWLGIFVAFILGLIFGVLYEWKKSMPLLILAHITLFFLLFSVFPFN